MVSVGRSVGGGVSMLKESSQEMALPRAVKTARVWAWLGVVCCVLLCKLSTITFGKPSLIDACQA